MSMPRAAFRSWTSGWTLWLSGLMAVETITGLALTLLPFSVATQTALIVHVVLAAPFLVPLCVYGWRHWRAYARHPRTHYKVSGYLTLALLVALTVSGAVLTWQAALGTRIEPLWRQVHLVTTWALVAAAGAHLLLLLVRTLRARSAPVGRYVFGTAAICLAGGAGWGGLSFGVPVISWRNEFPEGYGRPYGDDRPFAPSLARTESGGALDAASLSGSAGCGEAGCHEEIYREWQPSAHRYAAMDPGFQVIQKTMAQQNGPESTRYCGGCHDPISLFSGTKNVLVDEAALTSQPGHDEGVSCLACHAIRETDVKGNAAYVMTQPERYLFETSAAPAPKFLGQFLIRAWPDRHVETYSRRMFKTPEFCAACHKQFVDEEVNQVGWVQLQNQYDNWRKSHWNNPDEPEKTVECRECHMPLVDSQDPGAGDAADANRTAGDGRHRSHRFLGGNQWMPRLLKLPGAEEQVALTEKWLEGEHPIPEIADKWAEGPALGLEVTAPAAASPGQTLELQVVVSSNKVGHDFPTGPLDIIQTWVALEVKDATGRVVYASGRVDEKNFIEPGTFMFKAEPVDQQGNLIDKHNLWEMVGVRYRRSLFPGFTDTASYRFTVPAEVATGPLTVEARLMYRKVDQYLLDFAFGKDSGLTSPITRLATATATIPVDNG